MDVTGLLKRANLLLEQGRNKDAEKQIMQVLDQEPNNDHALSILARCYMNNDEVDKGIEVINKAIAIEPNESFYFYLLGFGYFQKEMYLPARDNLSKAIRLNPYNPEYFGILSFIYLNEKNYEVALQNANEGLELDPENITCLNARARALNKLKRTDEAIDNLEHGFIPASDFVKGKKENACPIAGVIPSLKNLDVNSDEMKKLITFLIEKKVTLTSTLPVFEPNTGREMVPGGGEDALASQIKEIIEKNYKASAGKDTSDVVLFKKEMAWEKQFVDMGGRLMAGIDPTGSGRTIPGYADRHVLELLVEAGFTFPQAVKICSLNAAEYMGKEKEIGTIETGKRADLVLIDGDPQTNIKAIRNTEIVFKNGVGYDSKKLFESVKGKVGLY